MDKTIRFIIVMVFVLLILVIISGCTMFQSRGTSGGTLTDLPTTGSEAMFQTLKKQNWLFTLSVIGVGAGFFAFLNGNSKGLQFMAACFVVLSLIIGVTKYSAVIAAIAMIGAVCLMVYSTVVKSRALREVILGVERVRDSFPELTHEDGLSKKLNSVQSKTTRAVVKSVKGTL